LKFSLEPSDRKQILLNWKYESNQMLLRIMDHYLNSDSTSMYTNSIVKYSIIQKLLQDVPKGKNYLKESLLVKVLETTKCKEVVKGLRFKSRVHPINDYNIRRGVTDILFNLNPQWLLYALSVVFEKDLELNKELTPASVKDTIQHLFFGGFTVDSEIGEVTKFIVNNFIKLSSVLDHALTHVFSRGDPALFSYTSKFLSTQDFFSFLINNYTSSDSTDIIIKLANLGIKFTYKQSRVQKHREPINNLALDLRNGINLAQFGAQHFDNWLHFEGLNLMPLTQEHKVNNMNLVFEFMNLHGLAYNHILNGPTKPIDIVLGDRNRSIGLLMSFLVEWKLPRAVGLGDVEGEIEKLSNQQSKEKTGSKTDSLDESFNSNNPTILALFKWCTLINQFFNFEVVNLSSSFKDPLPILYIFSYYLPKLFLAEDIKRNPEVNSQSLIENSENPTKRIRSDIPISYIQDNYTTLNKWSKQLGLLTNSINFQNGQEIDKNLIILFLAMIFQQIIKLSVDTEACSKIQRVWRRYYQDRRRSMGVYNLAESRVAVKKIQNWFKRYLLAPKARECRVEFIQQKDASIVIQSLWRSHLARSQLKLLKSAVKLQSWWKMATISRDYQQFKSNVIKIQSQYRCISTRNAYKTLKQSAIALQSRWRGRDTRTKLEKLQLATVTIQKFYRSLQLTRLTAFKYESLKYSAIVFQKHWRRLQAQRHLAYLLVLSRLQAYCRRYLVIQNISNLNRSCILIQRAYRSWRIKEELKRELAAIRVQSWYRMHRQQNQYSLDVSEYRITRSNAAIQIQKTFKMCHARKQYLSVYKANNAIITKWRATVLAREIQQQYSQVKQSAITLQNHWRNLSYTRMIRGQYIQKLNSAIVIQKYFRRYKAQLEVNQLRALINLQALIRSKLVQSDYQLLKRAVDVCQERRRALVVGRKAKTQYTKDRNSVLLLQVKWKAVLVARDVRASYNILKDSSINVQKWWRGRIAQIQYQQLQKATRDIQEWWRITRCKQEFNEKLQQFKLERKSAICIQANFLKYINQKKFLNLKQASQVLQARRRAIVKCRDIFYSYSALKDTSVILQRRRRATVLAKNISNEYQLLKSATITIQSQVRRQRCRNRYLTLKSASITMQKNFRKHQLQSHYNRLKLSVSNCQARVRAKQLGNSIRGQYLELKRAANVICKHWLSYKEWKLEQQRRWEASIKVQSQWRAFIARRQLHELRSEHYAATKIQSNFKRFVATMQYQKLRSASATLQRRYRQLLYTRRTHLNYNNLKCAALICQRLVRSKQETARVYNAYNQVKSTAIFLQYTIRRLWKIRERREESAIRIQTWFRSAFTRQNYLRDVAIWRKIVKIQNWFRMIRDRSVYLDTRSKVVWLQQKWRSALQSRIDQDHFVNVSNACRAIQVRFRANQEALDTRLNYTLLKLQTIKIQRWYRSVLDARLMNEAATKIQTLVLSFNARYRFYRKQLIRHTWSKLLIRVQCFNVLKNNILNNYRAIQFQQNVIKTKVLDIWREKCQERLIEIRRQAQIRKENLAATTLQHHIRLFLIRCRFLRICHSTYLLQRVIRGHFVRKLDIPDKRIRAIRKRVMKANAEATEEMKLCNRTTFALKAIAQSRCITTVMKACQHLVVVTRLSQICRHRLLKEYKCVQIILELMKSCNRSTPHQEMLKPAVQILEHLSLDDLGQSSLIRSVEQVGFILETMYFHNDLEFVLKGLLATLHHLMHSPSAFNYIKRTPDLKFKLRQIQSKMLRTQSRLSHLPKSRLSVMPNSYGHRQSYINRPHIGFDCHIFFSLPSMTEDKFELMEKVLNGLESKAPLTNLKQ
jgi:hypothetical protein